jgi:hypothetical protein
MKKVLFALILLGCIACSESEEVDPREAYFLESIIGSWAYDTVRVDGVTYLYQHTEGCVKDLFQFYNVEGKEFDFEEEVVLNCSNCAECALSQTGLEWKLKGDNIKLYFGSQLVLVYKIIEVDDTKFIYQVELDYDNDGDNDLLEITAVKYDPYDRFN